MGPCLRWGDGLLTGLERPILQGMTEETDLPPITDFHRHEVLHVAYIAADVFDRHLLEHRAVQSNADLREKAEAISTLLWDFYQAAGQPSDEAADREADT